MRILITCIAVCLFFIPCQTQAKIIETCNFADILTEIDAETLVFFDIDDTLINTTSMLGNTPCWNYLVSKFFHTKWSSDKTLDIYAVIQKILHHVPMSLIEPNTADIIQDLQQQGILVLGLTARTKNANYMQEADKRTYDHLKSVDIDFSLTPLPNSNKSPLSFFSYGIIFTDTQDKGPFLKTFLTHLGLHPKKVVFIDDKLSQIKSVQKSLKSINIPFVGFRYGKLDNFHTRFNPLIVNIQLEALIKESQVLSDEEAEEIALQNPHFSSDYFIQELINKWSL